MEPNQSFQSLFLNSYSQIKIPFPHHYIRIPSCKFASIKNIQTILGVTWRSFCSRKTSLASNIFCSILFPASFTTKTIIVWYTDQTRSLWCISYSTKIHGTLMPWSSARSVCRKSHFLSYGKRSKSISPLVFISGAARISMNLNFIYPVSTSNCTCFY